MLRVKNFQKRANILTHKTNGTHSRIKKENTHQTHRQGDSFIFHFIDEFYVSNLIRLPQGLMDRYLQAACPKQLDIFIYMLLVLHSSDRIYE